MKKSLGPKTLLFPAPDLIVCTYDKNGRPNAAAVAWGGICCSAPPCVNVSLRKATYTHGSIVLNKAFTVNVPSEKHVKAADYFGVASGRDRNKIEDTGLTPVKSELVNAPYIEEFPINLECKLVHTAELGRHTLFVGEVLDIKADEAVLNDRGIPDPEKVKPVIYAPLHNKYYGLGAFLEKSHVIKEWK